VLLSFSEKTSDGVQTPEYGMTVYEWIVGNTTLGLCILDKIVDLKALGTATMARLATSSKISHSNFLSPALCGGVHGLWTSLLFIIDSRSFPTLPSSCYEQRGLT
jgi:hypothetical protein